MKIFKKRQDPTDGQGNAQNPKHDTMYAGGQECQNYDATYAMDIINAALAHHEMPSNRFHTEHFAMVANQWNDQINWRSSFMFRTQSRIRNVGTGALNPSTQVLDLNNGTGAALANDAFLITWVHKGTDNDNVDSVHLWIRRNAVGGVGNSTLRLALCDVTATVTAAGAANMNVLTGEFNASLAGGDHDKVPLNLDQADYATAAIAYAEVACATIPAGGNGQIVHFDLQYNAAQANPAATGVGLQAGHVYCLILYVQQAAGGDTDTFNIYGGVTAAGAEDAESATYHGAAGWNGLIAADATCQSAFFQLFGTRDCVINQVHFYSPTGSTLGGAEIAFGTIMPDAETVINNDLQPTTNEMNDAMLFHDIELGDQRTHALIFEGKAICPRRHFLKMMGMVTYTGDLMVEINYWLCPSANHANLKGV